VEKAKHMAAEAIRRVFQELVEVGREGGREGGKEESWPPRPSEGSSRSPLRAEGREGGREGGRERGAETHFLTERPSPYDRLTRRQPASAGG